MRERNPPRSTTFLIGGGHIRSAGGWSAIKALRRIGAYQKGDELILGDSGFVKKVLAQAKDNFERKYHLKSNGFNVEKVLGRVAELLDLKLEQVLAVGKYKKTVAACSLLCFWAISELRISQSELGQKLKISQPAVNLAIKRLRAIGYTPQLLVKSLTVTYQLNHSRL